MKKTFEIAIKNFKAFGLIISGITEAQTLRFFTNNPIKIVTQFKQLLKGVAVIKGGKTSLKVLKFAISTKLTPEIKSKITIVTSFKETLQASSIFNLPLVINANLKESVKTASSIRAGKTNIIAPTILGTFWRLSAYDNVTLGTQDNETLQTMDYAVDTTGNSFDFSSGNNSFYMPLL